MFSKTAELKLRYCRAGKKQIFLVPSAAGEGLHRQGRSSPPGLFRRPKRRADQTAARPLVARLETPHPIPVLIQRDPQFIQFDPQFGRWKFGDL